MMGEKYWKHLAGQMYEVRSGFIYPRTWIGVNTVLKFWVPYRREMSVQLSEYQLLRRRWSQLHGEQPFSLEAYAFILLCAQSVPHLLLNRRFVSSTLNTNQL